MKTIGMTAVVAFGVGFFGLTGCSKDAEIDEFIKFNAELAADVEKKGKEGPEAATKVFEDRKGDLQKRYDAIKEARGFQVSEEKTKALEANVTDSVMKVCGAQITLDQKKSAQFKKLCDDYMAVLK
jgi:hypothetical protein